MSNREMNTFEQIITSIRNILRVEGISGLDSINHCVAFLVCRYLTIDKCTEFKIPLEFAFENFLKNEDGTNCDDHVAIGKFYNEDIERDCLFVHLREVLNFKSFKFKITAPLNFLNIYKKLDGININNLFDKIDIVGAIYELHLKTGTTGSGMRDLGQYFTNREVIKYMIILCDPKLKQNGDIESILDPSMGTGGFLSMSIKHLNKNFQNINWKLNKKRIYGFDVDETVKNMSILNALLECGQIFNETFVKNDTLHDDYKISDNVLIDKVDIILANEPFGLKNIIHKNVCKRIKDLKIEGTKAEPLFLQLMMQSLNIDGRCAVIVPDGVLFNDAKLHKLTRKYLCENLRLAKVISLEDGLFLNTGVKSSILFFVNDGKTEKVEFCKIKMSDSEIVEDLIITVNIKEIEKNDYSLFVNKYNKVEEDKIEGIEYTKFGDICNFLSTTKHNTTIGQTNGKYRFYNSSQDDRLYIDICEINKESIIIGNGGSICVHYDTNFTASKHVTVAQVNNDNYLTKYVYYYLLINRHLLIEQSAGSTIAWLNKTNMGNIKIPIPQLSIQQQIVEVLNSIYDTIEENNKLIQNYEKIKNGIIWSNTLNINNKKLNDICEFLPKSKRQASFGKEDGKYNFFTSSKNLTKYCDEIDYTDTCLIIGTGGNANIKISNNFSCSADNFVVKIIDNQVLSYYLYYWFINNMIKLEDCFHGSTIKHLSKGDLENIKIPIPSKEVQEFIVKECDYYDNLIDILKKENERLQNNKIIEIVLKSVSELNSESLINKSDLDENDELTQQIEKVNEIIDSAEEDLVKVKPKKKLTKKVKSNNV